MANTNKILWKPIGNHGGLVILFPYRAGNVVIRDNEGNIIARGRSTGPSNGFRDTIRFDFPGNRFNNIKVEDDTGRSFNIPDGSLRYENIGSGDGVSGTRSAPGRSPQGGDPAEGDSDGSGDEEASENTADDEGARPDPDGSGDLSKAPRGESEDVGEGEADTSEETPGGTPVPPPNLIDPGIITTPDPISFPVIPIPDFNFTDPLDTASRVGDFNRERSEENFVKAIERSRELSAQELEAVKQFAAGVSDFQIDLLRTENDFNQQERLKAAEVAIPGVSEIFSRQRERAETLAEGRFLDTAQDRAFELTARNASAEGSVQRGFGDDSVVGRATSDKLSAQQRLGLQTTGESFLNQSIAQATNLLFDAPTKANIAQRLPAQSAVAVTQLAPLLQQQENALTTVTPQFAQQSITQQEQFKTNTQSVTDRFNATGQFDAAQFNSNQLFEATLSRANIIAGNVAAQNEADRAGFNVDEARKQRAEDEAQLNDAFDDFKRHKSQSQLLETIGFIFGGIALVGIPQWAKDLIKRTTGIDVDNLTGAGDDSSSGTGTGTDSDAPPQDPGSGTGSGNTPPLPEGGVTPEEEGQQSTEPSETPVDGSDPTVDPGGSTPFDPDTEFANVKSLNVPFIAGESREDHAFRTLQLRLKLAGFTQREIALILQQIDIDYTTSTGVTLNLGNDEELAGII